MTAILDRIPVDRITAEAREVPFWRTVLTVIAGVLYGVGWVAAKVLGAVWTGLVWTATAVKVGWRDGRPAARDSGS